MTIASDAGRIVSLTLSDSFCVDRHRDEWMDLLDDRVDLVFANDAEVCSMFETDDFDAAARQIADMVEVAALTRSAEGSVVLANGERFDVPATPVERVVDATGAGDLFASGFIYGLSLGAPRAVCRARVDCGGRSHHAHGSAPSCAAQLADLNCIDRSTVPAA